MAVVVGGEIFAPQLVELIAPGFSPAEKARVIFLTRLMLPAQICFYQGSILSAVQYAKGQFVVPSLAPVVYNLGIILGGVLLSPRIGITGFAVGVLAGAVAGNFLLQVYGARRAGARFSPNLDVRHPGFWLFIKLTIPIMLALSLVFTDDWIMRWFGSSLQAGAISWLNYAKNLMRVPLGVVGQAVGVASFPFLAQLYSGGKAGRAESNPRRHDEGPDSAALAPIGPHHCPGPTADLPRVFAHAYAAVRPASRGGGAGGLFPQHVRLGSPKHRGARILCGARHADACHHRYGADLAESARVLVDGPSLRLPGTGAGEFRGDSGLHVLLFGLLNRRTKNREWPDMVWFFLKITLASVVAALLCSRLTAALQARIGWQSTLHALLVLVIVSSVGFVLTTAFAKALRVRELDSYLARLRR